ncbi:hypothetical protein HDV00_001745 [Rhizophlyctis rosea]|nr:hypothetical protein HDV00_001745 [Rhizophlyctis rosea]
MRIYSTNPMLAEFAAKQPFSYTKPTGTSPSLLQPAEAERDCKTLRAAMKGLGTDEDAIIHVLCNRTAEQCEQLVTAYKAHLGRDLEKDLEKECSGKFKHVMTLLLYAQPKLDAVFLEKAMKGLGTDEDALIEILTGRTNTEINDIKAAYQFLYNKDLEKEVKSETSGHFAKLLTATLQGARDNQQANWNVQDDVDALYKAGIGKVGTDESVFISILVTRPVPHLRQVFEAYYDKHNEEIEESIKKEFSGDVEKALLSLVASIRSRSWWIASLFEKSMAGLGTRDHQLIRLTVRHRDADVMKEIKQAYQQQFGKDLYHRVQGETSGDYRKALQAIIKP